jgi:hypothetical protein
MYYGTQKFATNCKKKTKIGKQNHWLIKVVLRYTKICNKKQNQNQKLEKNDLQNFHTRKRNPNPGDWSWSNQAGTTIVSTMINKSSDN